MLELKLVPSTELEPTISSGRLKSSLPWILHRHSIKLVFYKNGCGLFLRKFSSLDAFSSYTCGAWLLCTTLPDDRYTRGSSPGFLSYCPDFPLRPQTLPADSNRSGSRRSKPSSRSVLMGEHPHPWLLLHSQDTESRHRSNKPEGRCELAPQTIQLSLEYLFRQA